MNTSRMVYVTMVVATLLVSQVATSRAQLTPTTVTANGPDDSNTSTLNPSPIIPVGAGTTVPQCPWINAGLANAGYVASNGWNITWASSIPFLQPDLSIKTYNAWAVNSGDVTGLNGTVYSRYVTNQDAGGANFQLQYTPQAGDPTNNLHWIQAFQESFNGGPTNISLDNDMRAWTNGTPFYDTLGVAGMGTLSNNASWMLDIPYDFEAATYGGLPGGEESLTNSDVQFQVVLASDDFSNGVHKVAIYGGDWWGYKYSNFDVVPEPSSLALLSIGVLVLIGIRRRVRR